MKMGQKEIDEANKRAAEANAGIGPDDVFDILAAVVYIGYWIIKGLILLFKKIGEAYKESVKNDKQRRISKVRGSKTKRSN